MKAECEELLEIQEAIYSGRPGLRDVSRQGLSFLTSTSFSETSTRCLSWLHLTDKESSLITTILLHGLSGMQE